MRKLIFIILTLFCISASAQDSSGGNLTFIYINHTVGTPVQVLCKRLDEAFKTAKKLGDPLIIYLPNGNNPYVASVGINGVEDTKYDNIIKELQVRRYHSVDPRNDVVKIVELFDKNDFLYESGMPKYSSMTWQFYIDQDFWDANYNEHIIAKLYFTLDLDKLPSDYLHLMLFYHGEEEFVYDQDNVFGIKRLCENLEKLEILYY